MSTSQFTLTEEDVRSWTESRFIERGIGYYEKGAIMHPRVEGNVLRALCRGSRPHPYEVRARLDEEWVREQVREICAVGRPGEGWEEIFSQDWQSLFDLAAGARDRGQWGQAVTVAAAMTEELGRCYEDQLHPIDRENRVLDWMWTPAGLLADAVREVEDEAVRRRALEALFCLIRNGRPGVEALHGGGPAAGGTGARLRLGPGRALLRASRRGG